MGAVQGDSNALRRTVPRIWRTDETSRPPTGKTGRASRSADPGDLARPPVRGDQNKRSSAPDSIFTVSPGLSLIFDPGAISAQTCPLASVTTSSPCGLARTSVTVATISDSSPGFSLRVAAQPELLLRRNDARSCRRWRWPAGAAPAAAAGLRRGRGSRRPGRVTPAHLARALRRNTPGVACRPSRRRRQEAARECLAPQPQPERRPAAIRPQHCDNQTSWTHSKSPERGRVLRCPSPASSHCMRRSPRTDRQRAVALPR